MTVVHANRSSGRLRWSSESPWFDVVVSMVSSWLLLVPTGLLDLPPKVDQVTIQNPSAYEISVEVSDADGDSWLGVTTVGRGETGRNADVIDQGDVWRFRFRSQGRAGGELTIPRGELVAADWEVRIPESVGQRLAELGAPPAPP